ncbi:hypothetical protein EZS27_035628, partial [termite gut metagenome]
RSQLLRMSFFIMLAYVLFFFAFKLIKGNDISSVFDLNIYSCFFIVYFSPRDSKFNYRFDINRPWGYEPLIATFDFPIYKSDAVIERERDSITAFFQPYYKYNGDVKKEVFDKIEKSYDTFKSLFPSPDYFTYIRERLDKAYEIGIISMEDAERLYKEGTVAIRVSDGKLPVNRITHHLFTIQRACEYILSPDSAYHYKEQFLRKYPVNDYLLPNLTFDEQLTDAAKEELFASYCRVNGMVQSGQKIIDRGEIINEHTYAVLESLREESDKRSETPGQKRLILTGQILFVGLLVLFLIIYLELFRNCYYERRHRRSLLLLFALMILYCVITSLNLFDVYIIPYAMVPIIIRVFFDSRTAFMTLLVMILICSVTVNSPYEFVLFQLCAGLVSIFGLRELSQRSQLLRMSFFIMLAYVLFFFAFKLIKGNDISSVFDLNIYSCFVINALLLLFT